jgi:hypothetical protein
MPALLPITRQHCNAGYSFLYTLVVCLIGHVPGFKAYQLRCLHDLLRTQHRPQLEHILCCRDAGLMNADFQLLPSYSEAVNPENAAEYPILSIVPVSYFPSHCYTGFHCSTSNRAAWEFQSLCGAFKSFGIEVSCMLDVAQTYGLSTFEIPERNWFFDFKEMTQSNYLVNHCDFLSYLHILMVCAVRIETNHPATFSLTQ